MNIMAIGNSVHSEFNKVNPDRRRLERRGPHVQEEWNRLVEPGRACGDS
jgi:hypothetical protein